MPTLLHCAALLPHGRPAAHSTIPLSIMTLTLHPSKSICPSQRLSRTCLACSLAAAVAACPVLARRCCCRWPAAVWRPGRRLAAGRWARCCAGWLLLLACVLCWAAVAWPGWSADGVLQGSGMQSNQLDTLGSLSTAGPLTALPGQVAPPHSALLLPFEGAASPRRRVNGCRCWVGWCLPRAVQLGACL